MVQEIIFEGTAKNKTRFLIRYPGKNDGKKMHAFINSLSREKTFVNYQGEKISLKEEEEYLSQQLQRIQKRKSVELLVFNNSIIIGVASIDLGEGASMHEGILGISILESFRNLGIGNILLKLILKEAQEKLIDLRIVTLTVFDINSIANNVYKSYGFKEFGRLPKGIVYKNKNYDRVYMFKNLAKSRSAY